MLIASAALTNTHADCFRQCAPVVAAVHFGRHAHAVADPIWRYAYAVIDRVCAERVDRVRGADEPHPVWTRIWR